MDIMVKSNTITTNSRVAVVVTKEVPTGKDGICVLYPERQAIEDMKLIRLLK